MKLTMNGTINIAKNILIKNGYTCVLYSEKKEYHSTLRGVKPLIEFLNSGENFSECCAADKTVGLGAAHLYILLGVKSVWANVMSTSAKKILEQNNIQTFCDNEVAYIINRAKSGPCPIESAVSGITDSEQALGIIIETLKKLKT